jgi:hypothetical protein
MAGRSCWSLANDLAALMSRYIMHIATVRSGPECSMLDAHQNCSVFNQIHLRRAETSRLVAEKGKLVRVVEPSGVVPNGTAFAVTLGAMPELDSINLVVGQVTDGLDTLVEASKLPVVKDNSNSVFFKAGKAIGDKRANVAELSFNRPFNRIQIGSTSTSA